MAERSSGGRRQRPVARSARAAALTDAQPAPRLRQQFCRRLALRLGSPVEIEVTNNTYTMISFSKKAGAYRVRLHHMFLLASDDIVRTLGGYIRGDDRKASVLLDRYIHENRRLIRKMTPVARQKRLTLTTAGRTHDLAALLEDVRESFPQYFGTEVGRVAIAWAPAPVVKLPRRSIKLGSYSADTQIIRIHPALDQREVPIYFVKWIIFHELLHHRFRADLRARNGRVHTPEFNALERRFPRFFEALVWERGHLDLLLWWTAPTALVVCETG